MAFSPATRPEIVLGSLTVLAVLACHELFRRRRIA
jgi:hypothetical protein